MGVTDLEEEVWVSDGGEVLVDGRVEPALCLEDVVVPLGCNSIDIIS